MSRKADKRLRKKKRRKGMVNPLTRTEEWMGFAFRKGRKKIQDFFSEPCSSPYVPLDGNPLLVRQKAGNLQG
jgi:hypothetical protein